MIRRVVLLALVLGFLAGISIIGEGKSIYVIANHHTRQFDAWNIEAPGVVPRIAYQATYNLSHANDPAGVAVDNDSATLFITSEFDYGVELVDATTMKSLGWVTGAMGLGGIDIDGVNDIVYTVKRGSDDIYVYDWDPVAKTLTLKSGYPKDLPNCDGAWGLALDESNGRLYVADSKSQVVRVYNVATLTQVSSFAPSIPPVGIEIDRRRGFVYTTAPDGSCAGNTPYGYTLLSKYDLATGLETTVDMGHGGMGIAVDEVTGYVYVTGGCSGDDISIWDSNLTFIEKTGDIGNPAGIAIGNVSYNPLSLAKNDTIVGYGVYIGQEFTYELTYDNKDSASDATNVTIVDKLPAELDFVSEKLNGTPDTGVYDSVAHTVTWDIGTLSAGYTGGLIELVVKVNQNAVSETTIYNYCTIDSDQTPPTTVVGGDPDNPDPDEPGTHIIPDANKPPIANAGPDQTITDTDGDGQEDVALDGSKSDDPDGSIANWVWTESGNQVATGETPTVTLSVGTHTITLTVTDNDGATDTDEVTIVIASGHAVNSPNEPSGPRSGGVDELLKFSTSGSTCSKGHPVEYQFNWDSNGEDDLSEWSSSTSAYHSYSSEDTYQVKAQARCAIDTSVVSGWSAAKTVIIGSPSDEHAPIADASDIDVGDVPETMYPNTFYTVTAKYYDADGRDDLNICYLRLNHPSKPLTMMWYQADGHATSWAGEKGERYLTVSKVRSTEIPGSPEGYELVWTFKINESWPKVENAIDFGVFALDDDGLDSGDWDYDDTNASYDNTNQPPNTKIETADIDSSKRVAIFTWSGSDKETPSAQLVYKHRLLNPDFPLYGWSNWSSSTTATYPRSVYSRLPDGSYRFQVKAKDADGAIQPDSAVWEFTIGIQAPASITLVPFYPASTAEDSTVMGTGILHRYFQILDGQGSPVSGAKIYLKREYLNSTDSFVTTSGNNGVFPVKARAGNIGQPNACYLVQLIDRIEVAGSAVNCDLSAAEFEIDIHPLEYSQAWKSMHGFKAGVDIGAQVAVGVVSLKGATMGLDAGKSISRTLGYETRENGDFLVLDRKFSVSVSPNMKLAKGEVTVGKVGVGVEAGATITGYGDQTFEVENSRSTNAAAKELQAAFFWDTLVAEGAFLLFDPITATLLHALSDCVITWLYDEYAPNNYLSNTAFGGSFKFKGTVGFTRKLSIQLPGQSKLVSLELPHIDGYALGALGWSTGTDEGRVQLDIETGGSIGAGIEFSVAGDAVKGKFGIGGEGAITSAIAIVDSHTSERSDRVEITLGREFGWYIGFAVGYDDVGFSEATMAVSLDSLRTVSASDLPVAIGGAIVGGTLSTVPLIGGHAPSIAAFTTLGTLSMMHGWDSKIQVENGGRSTIETELGIDLALGIGVHASVPLKWVVERSWPKAVYHTVGKFPWLVLTEQYDDPDAQSWLKKEEIESTLSENMMSLARRAWDKFAKALGYIRDKVEKVIEGTVQFGKKAWKGAKDGFHAVVESGKHVVKGTVVKVTQFGEGVMGGVKGFLGIKEEKTLQGLAPLAVAIEPFAVITNGLVIEIIDPQGNSLPQFNAYVELSISYTDEQLAAAGLGMADEQNLKVYWWDPHVAKWDSVQSFANPGENYITGLILNAGIYVVGLANTSPQVELLSPKGGETITTDFCSISWMATDDQDPGELAIDILLSSTGTNSSWSVIAEDLPNTGSYQWDVTRVWNGEYVIKIIVVDALGSSTEIVSEPFFITTVPKTTGIIIALNPVTGAGAAFFYSLPEETTAAKFMIFSVSGRLVFEDPLDVNSSRFPSAGTWNPVDNDGVKLANGPYLYVLIANGQLIGQGKMVIQR